MKSIRFLATMPTGTASKLSEFAAQHESTLSVVAQQAVSKMSDHMPRDEDIVYDRGDTEGVQLSFSETAYRLLEKWADQTSLSKSKLVSYSLQETIVKKGQV